MKKSCEISSLLHYYVPRYSGKSPEMIDGYSCGVGTDKGFGINFGVNATQRKIVDLMISNPHIKAQEIADMIGITKRNVEYAIRTLKKEGIVIRVGAAKNGQWMVKFD